MNLPRLPLLLVVGIVGFLGGYVTLAPADRYGWVAGCMFVAALVVLADVLEAHEARKR